MSNGDLQILDFGLQIAEGDCTARQPCYSSAAFFLTFAFQTDGAQAAPRVLFSDDFERHAVGAQLGTLQPVVGDGYTDTGNTIIAAADALPGSEKQPSAGERCARCNANGAVMRMSEADAAAVRGQTVRFRFDLYLTPEAAGSTDIQTFLAGNAEAFRAFNLLIDQAGNVRYYAAGAEHPVPGRVPVGTWVPVEILADYARHVYRARVGDVCFVAPFDKKVDEFTQIYFGKAGSPTYYYDNVLVELAPELAQELAVAAAALVSIETELRRPLQTRVSPFDVGTAAQLFVDRVLVRDSERVWFTQHEGRKHPDNPVLKPDQPWEGWRTEIFGNVIFDEEEQLFKMWYLPEPAGDGGYFDDPNATCYATRELYVAFPKVYPVSRGHNRRLFATIISKDFVHWTNPVLSFDVDLRDDAGSLARLEQVRPVLDRPDDPRLMRTEYYGIGAYAAESCLLAFPWILTVNNNARWGNHEGPEEIQLAVSRDLLHWERPFRTPIIAIGELGSWDASYHTTAATALRVKDEIWLYYSGANYTHGSPPVYRTTFEDGKPTGRKTRFSAAIGLVTWPLDRFVSADAGSDGGVLTTIPIRRRGSLLEINAAVRPGGQITVELLDAASRPLDGFPPSEPFTGNDLRHVVRFAGQTDVSATADKALVLRFAMKNAELYSFAFRDKHTVKSEGLR